MSWSSVIDYWSLLAAMLFGAVGIWMMLPPDRQKSRLIPGIWFFAKGQIFRRTGGLLSLVGLVLLAMHLSRFGGFDSQLLFWFLSGFTAVSAVATIMMRSPVYSAIWFALTLFATSGLLLLQEAQFLAVATIIVYAGAILVTFLFVLMLAEPAGHAVYDRISWGHVAPLLAVLSGVSIVGGLTFLLSKLESVPPAASLPTENHMAQLGAELFSRHLLEVELAGTLLLIALVGAIAIAEDARRRSRRTAASNGGRGS
jgi:NADH-quinone oxidoreductase subunit J